MTASRAVLFASSHMILVEVPKHFTHQSRNSFYVPRERSRDLWYTVYGILGTKSGASDGSPTYDVAG